MKTFLSLLAFCALACSFATADEPHHEEVTAEQLGSVHFPVSCSAGVQKPFEKGVALLHSFWYEEAEKAFQGVEKQDPNCALAYWGDAMSRWHQLWNHPDEKVLGEGRALVKRGESKHPKTAREQGYLVAAEAFYKPVKMEYQARAQAYADAMQKVYAGNPDDHEAATFYALSLLASEPEDDTTFANRKRAAEVLEKVFATDPDHPGVAHYLIHSYDKPQLAEKGLPAARRYARIAPSAPHALHMPSHIFARVGMWQEDIDSNLASIAATRKTAAMHMGGAGHQFHAMDYLVYAYLQSGREAEAKKVVEEVEQMPPMKDMYGMGYDQRASALSNLQSMVAVELHHWKEAAQLQPVKGGSDADEAWIYWARAIGAARSGNLPQARTDVARMEAIHKQLLTEKATRFAANLTEAIEQAKAWVGHAEGKNDEALASLRKWAVKEENEGDEPLAIPAREMAADMLLEMKNPDAALTEYKADLKFNPNRFNGLYGAGQAADMLGQTSQASGYYNALLKSCAGANSDRPELARAKALVAQK